ncbi:hypothetical protein [Streptomyces hirsutus]|uniref:hypothetical protein n=1 Tax=Streptomyces hirsutus TaxID=35620 RepID=UPI00364CD948
MSVNPGPEWPIHRVRETTDSPASSCSEAEKWRRARLADRNEQPRPFVRTKTADEILKSLADHLTRIAPPATKNRQET